MTVIRPNSISGVSSITGSGGDILIFRADGTAADVTVNNITSGVVTATSFSGSGANLTGIDATAIQTGNTKVQTSATLISNQISGSGIATFQAGGLDVTGIVTATSFEYSSHPGHSVFTGNNSTTAFTIQAGHSVDSILVVYNGAVLTPTTDYTVSGTTLTMNGFTPPTNAHICVRYLIK